MDDTCEETSSVFNTRTRFVSLTDLPVLMCYLVFCYHNSFQVYLSHTHGTVYFDT